MRWCDLSLSRSLSQRMVNYMHLSLELMMGPLTCSQYF